MNYVKMKYSDDSNPFWFEVVNSGQFTGSPVTWYSGFIVSDAGVRRGTKIEIHSTDLYYVRPAEFNEAGLLESKFRRA